MQKSSPETLNTQKGLVEVIEYTMNNAGRIPTETDDGHNLEKPRVYLELGYYGYHQPDPCFHGQSQENVRFQLLSYFGPSQTKHGQQVQDLVFPEKYIPDRQVVAVLLHQWTFHGAGGR